LPPSKKVTNAFLTASTADASSGPVTGGDVEAVGAVGRVVEAPTETTVVGVVGTTDAVGTGIVEVVDDARATLVTDVVVAFELLPVEPHAATTSAETMAMVLLMPIPPDRVRRDRRVYG
jgi:hypothetical protein